MIVPNQVVRGKVAGVFRVLGLRTIDGVAGAQLKEVDPNDHERMAAGEIWLPLHKLTPA